MRDYQGGRPIGKALVSDNSRVVYYAKNAKSEIAFHSVI